MIPSSALPKAATVIFILIFSIFAPWLSMNTAHAQQTVSSYYDKYCDATKTIGSAPSAISPKTDPVTTNFVTYSWTPVQDQEKAVYILELASDPDFNRLLIDENPGNTLGNPSSLVGSSDPRLTMMFIKSSVTAYWHVFAVYDWKERICSPVSAPESVTFNIHQAPPSSPPAIPKLKSPVDGIVISGNTLTLEWEPLDNQSSVINYVVGKNEDTGGKAYYWSHDSVTKMTLPISGDGDFSWYVVAVDATAQQSQSNPETFAIDNQPPVIGDFTMPEIFGEGSTLSLFLNVSDKHDISEVYATISSESNPENPLDIVAAKVGDHWEISYAFPDKSIMPDGKYGLTITAKDNAQPPNQGNSPSKPFILDQTAPVITVPPSPLVIKTPDPSGTFINYTATATDNLDGPLTPICTPPSGSFFKVGDTTVTCTATDKAGNNPSASFVVVIPPPPDHITINLSSSNVQVGQSVNVSGQVFDKDSKPLANVNLVATVASASQNLVSDLNGAYSTSFQMTSAGKFNAFVKTADGNVQSQPLTLTVTPTPNTPPVITVPKPITEEATGPDGAIVNFSDKVSATDKEDGPLTPICTPPSGSTFPIEKTEPGITIVTCTVTDSGVLSDTKTFQVKVQDTTPPEIRLDNIPSGPIHVEKGKDGAGISYTVTATDLVDGTVSTNDKVPGKIKLVCTPSSDSFFKVGTNTVTCTATDLHGNEKDVSFPVEIINDPPVITIDPQPPIRKEATGPDGAVANYSASAKDAEDGDVPVECKDFQSGSIFPLGKTTITCSATDSDQNVSTRSFVIVVEDTTPPIITVPTELSKETFNESGMVVDYARDVFASDAVDGVDIVLECIPKSGSMFALGKTTVNCTAIDKHGNTANASFLVEVKKIDIWPIIAAIAGVGATIAGFLALRHHHNQQ